MKLYGLEKIFHSNMHQILDNLWLGDISAASNLYKLRQKVRVAPQLAGNHTRANRSRRHQAYIPQGSSPF